MELVADSMLIIDKGKKLVEGNVKELFDPSAMIVELIATDLAGTAAKLELAGFSLLKGMDDEALYLKMNRESIPAFTRKLVEMDVQVISLHPRHSLEDYFLSITKKPALTSTHNP
jgi:ABC-type multidrug transport system ATPase subunit